MELAKITDRDDERRCKGASKWGQCTNLAVENQDFCPCHGGNQLTADRENRLSYQIINAEYRQRIAELADGDQAKSVRQEVGMLKVLLEKRFNMIKNDNDLIAACAPINMMLTTLDKLVKSLHTMEKELGILLSRETVIQLGREIARILTDELAHLDDRTEIIDRIIPRIGNTILALSKGQSTEKL